MCRIRNIDVVSTLVRTTTVFHLWKSCSTPCLSFCSLQCRCSRYSGAFKNIYYHSFKTKGYVHKYNKGLARIYQRNVLHENALYAPLCSF